MQYPCTQKTKMNLKITIITPVYFNTNGNKNKTSVWPVKIIFKRSQL